VDRIRVRGLGVAAGDREFRPDPGKTIIVVKHRLVLPEPRDEKFSVVRIAEFSLEYAPGKNGEYCGLITDFDELAWLRGDQAFSPVDGFVSASSKTIALAYVIPKTFAGPLTLTFHGETEGVNAISKADFEKSHRP